MCDSCHVYASLVAALKSVPATGQNIGKYFYLLATIRGRGASSSWPIGVFRGLRARNNFCARSFSVIKAKLEYGAPE